MKNISSFKLVFFNYLRSKGYNVKKMLSEEISFILEESKENLPQNPDIGQKVCIYSEIYDTELCFVYSKNGWSLIL